MSDATVAYIVRIAGIDRLVCPDCHPTMIKEPAEAEGIEEGDEMILDEGNYCAYCYGELI